MTMLKKKGILLQISLKYFLFLFIKVWFKKFTFDLIIEYKFPNLYNPFHMKFFQHFCETRTQEKGHYRNTESGDTVFRIGGFQGIKYWEMALNIKKKASYIEIKAFFHWKGTFWLVFNTKGCVCLFFTEKIPFGHFSIEYPHHNSILSRIL